MRSNIFAVVVTAVCAMLPIMVLAAPTVTIYTDADTYQSGDTIEVSLSAENDAEAMSVAVYVGLILPNGDIWSTQYDGWRHTIEPWIPDIYVPAWFEMSRVPFWTFELPCAAPPIGQEGQYYFASVLTYPGTFEYVNMASLAPFAVGAAASDYYVNGQLGDDSNDGSQDAPWKTITHALASVEGSQDNPVTIHVAAATYAASTNGETFPLNMKSWVSVVGEGRETTILDAQEAAYHVIHCSSVNHLAIKRLTITGGKASGPEVADKSGGGIFCSESSPTIENNTITGNSADGDGGGISCWDNSPATIENNTIAGNSAGWGGGISCTNNSSPTFENNTITGNSALWGGGGIACSRGSATFEDNTVAGNNAQYGGGMYCEDTAAAILRNSIEDNTAVSYGGGVCCYFAWPTIDNNAIRGNTAYGGGGVYVEQCSPFVSNNTIEGNSAYSGGGIQCLIDASANVSNNAITGNSAYYSGGGMDCNLSSPTINNNLITGNTAHWDYGGQGGGISCDCYSSPTVKNNTISGNRAAEGGGISCSYYSSPAIENNTISDNIAEFGYGANGGAIYCWYCSPMIKNNVLARNSTDFGGGIYCCEDTSPIVVNNTIVGNTANEQGGGICCRYGGSATITDCIIWGNGRGDLYDCSATYCCIQDHDAGEGNIHEDPMFVSGPLGDYYLHPDSRCIDAGSRSASTAGLADRTTQADGTPDTGTVDMGYHYPIE